jgi:hypothetical protein
MVIQPKWRVFKSAFRANVPLLAAFLSVSAVEAEQTL